MILNIFSPDIEDLQDLVSERDDHPATKPRWIFDRVPKWFINAMRRLSPGSSMWDAELPGGSGEAAVMVFQELRFWDSSWFDHAGWVGNSLVSEPYHLDSDGIVAIASFCEKTGTTFRIRGSSYHYPTMTLRITIQPKK